MTALTDDIIEMHDMNFKAKVIADTLGCSTDTVYNAIGKHRRGMKLSRLQPNPNLVVELKKTEVQIRFHRVRLASLERHYKQLSNVVQEG